MRVEEETGREAEPEEEPYQQRMIALDGLLPDVLRPNFEALTTGAAQPFW